MLRLSESYSLATERPVCRQIVFFDIETTGFSRRFHQVGLISLAYRLEDRLELIQYLAEEPAEEGLIITAALREINQHLAYVSYNGDRFDIPFLNERSHRLGLASRLEPKRSLDLYRLLGRGKLIQTEAMSGFERQDELSGAQWAKGYRRFLAQPSEELRDRLLRHCREDVLSLVQLLQSAPADHPVHFRILQRPPRLITELIVSPGNLRAQLIDPMNQITTIDLPLLDTPSFSVLDDPDFDQLTPEAKKDRVFIEYDQLIPQRVHKYLQIDRAI